MLFNVNWIIYLIQSGGALSLEEKKRLASEQNRNGVGPMNGKKEEEGAIGVLRYEMVDCGCVKWL